MARGPTASCIEPEATRQAFSYRPETMERNQVNTVECHGCGKDNPLVYGGNLQIRDGLCFDFAGHYGGFFDMLGIIDWPYYYLVLCHDCCLTFFEAFPKIADRFSGYGLHYFVGERCCEYGWTNEQEENDGQKH